MCGYDTTVRVYNELLSDVVTDADAEDDVPPTGWTWRGRRYRVLATLEYWTEVGEWWRREDGLIPRVRSWRLEASSARGQGVVEICHDSAEDAWRIMRVLD